MKHLITLCILIILICIALQDFKERKVSLFLLVLAGVFLGYLHLSTVESELFQITCLINLSIIGIILLTLHVYSMLILKKKLNETFGLGDALFFIVMAVAFPTVAFVLLFLFSLLFASFLFLLFKKRWKEPTVPLAGLQALFTAFIILIEPFYKLMSIYSM